MACFCKNDAVGSEASDLFWLFNISEHKMSAMNSLIQRLKTPGSYLESRLQLTEAIRFQEDQHSKHSEQALSFACVLHFCSIFKNINHASGTPPPPCCPQTVTNKEPLSFIDDVSLPRYVVTIPSKDSCREINLTMRQGGQEVLQMSFGPDNKK